MENKHINEEKLLNINEAAKYLGVSVITLWRKLGRGKGNTKVIDCYRVGRRVLFSKEKHLLPYLARWEEKAEG
jgi:excisionase family DNA binding protein